MICYANIHQRNCMKLNFLSNVELHYKGHKKCDFSLILSVLDAKTGINYSDLELGNKFWNWVRVLFFATNN